MSKRLDYEVGDCTGRLGGDGDARLGHRPIMGISVISRIGSVMIAAPKTGPVQVVVFALNPISSGLKTSRVTDGNHTVLIEKFPFFLHE